MPDKQDCVRLSEKRVLTCVKMRSQWASAAMRWFFFATGNCAKTVLQASNDFVLLSRLEMEVGTACYYLRFHD